MARNPPAPPQCMHGGLRASANPPYGLLALAAGCSTLDKINPFADEPKDKPAALVELKNPMAVKTAWKYSLGKSGAYNFSPAAAAGSVFVADADGGVARLDAASGKQLWRVKAGSDLTAGVGVSPNGEIVVVGGVKGNIIAFDGSGKPAVEGADLHRATCFEQLAV
eukprot:gene33842-41748_t